ncbi:hypothetical protein B0J18DRAFT_57655 [Chaetomium sp. MPI-SDFR-AT-0129]|nr:hypothetical protein B0J18DRAFT_57655 [Chaetomium sp. MPI-SDFR-AT-0129]
MFPLCLAWALICWLCRDLAASITLPPSGRVIDITPNTPHQTSFPLLTIPNVPVVTVCQVEFGVESLNDTKTPRERRDKFGTCGRKGQEQVTKNGAVGNRRLILLSAVGRCPTD